MARRKKRSDDHVEERDDLSSLLAQPSRPMRPSPVIVPRTDVWRTIEDLRTFNPGGPYRSAHSFRPSPVNVTRLSNVAIRPSRNIQRTVRSGQRLQTKTPTLGRDRLAFEVPKSVLVCARRKMRKEVLFAKRKTGKGARSRKHRNIWSIVKC